MMQYAYNLGCVGRRTLFVCSSREKLLARPPKRPTAACDASEEGVDDAQALGLIEIKYVSLPCVMKVEVHALLFIHCRYTENEEQLHALLIGFQSGTAMASEGYHALFVDDLQEIVTAARGSPSSSQQSPSRHGPQQGMMHLAGAVALAAHAVDWVDSKRPPSSGRCALFIACGVSAADPTLLARWLPTQLHMNPRGREATPTLSVVGSDGVVGRLAVHPGSHRLAYCREEDMSSSSSVSTPQAVRTDMHIGGVASNERRVLALHDCL